MNDKLPPWVIGEEGVEIPFAYDPYDIDVVRSDIDQIRCDKKRMRTLRWHLLKTALKFFFTGRL